MAIINTSNSNNNTYQSVADFYSGRSIFITGGTGFLGKIIIEKLLYSCPDINKIYVLIRDKNGVNPLIRIKEITDNVVFKRLREKRPKDLEKLIPIVGDVSAPNLGISIDDENILLEQVSVVIHSAATVRFDEPLRVALQINLEGTIKILKLCERIQNLKVFVYVSTAFSNTDRDVIDEVIYPPPEDLNIVYEFVKKYGDNEKETLKLLKGRPNTYTYTKALAETYVANNHGKVPTVIIRPSIITSTNKEPLEGWLENWNGGTNFLLAATMGIFRVIKGSGHHVADIIPVDFVSNLTIVAGAKHQISNEVGVYNCCTSSANPINWTEIMRRFISEGSQLGMNKLPMPNVVFVKTTIMAVILAFFLQWLPSFIMDFWNYITGQQTKFVKYQTMLWNGVQKIDYFTSHSWTMHAHKTIALSSSLSLQDQMEFPFDVKTINWSEYIPKYCRGVQEYLMNRRKR